MRYRADNLVIDGHMDTHGQRQYVVSLMMGCNQDTSYTTTKCGQGRFVLFFGIYVISY